MFSIPQNLISAAALPKKSVNSINKSRLQQRLNYQFKDANLFELALTHRSCGSHNNERLEFLGDSILNFIIAEALSYKFTEAREGQLSRLRSQLVKGETLAEIAREFELGPCLNLGEGELKSGGFRRDSILADAVEALIGAIYQEAGMDIVRQRVLVWYDRRLQELTLTTHSKDPKTALQEFLQAKKAPLPQYQVVEIDGQAHAQQFTVQCSTQLLDKPTEATASSRRVAEREAAALALQQLQAVAQ